MFIGVIMKFPYGISDFYDIITENYYYVDRSDKIPLIEKAGKHLLFLRPRRFGKSLWLSTLENYYDLAKTDEFETLFGHLAIGKKPTAKHNKYFILSWDFSTVSPLGTTEKMEQNLHDHINGRIENCVALYGNSLPSRVKINPNNSLESLQSLLTAIQQTPYKLYLIIDEYDNFANEVMMSKNMGEADYKKLLYGEGIFKTIFKTIKFLSSGRGLDRVFITGVSPVVMADMTSGYNIVKSIYLSPEFNDLCGFTESEIKAILNLITTECQFPIAKTDEALAMMKLFYNGYAFTYDQKPNIYNPTLAFYFLEHFQDYCDYPRKILDTNLAMDRNRIIYLSQLAKGEDLILDLIDEKKPLTIKELADQFGIDDMLSQQKDYGFLASLMYYLGVLTIEGNSQTAGIILRIPNLVVRKLYIEQIQKILLPDINKDEAIQAAKSLYTKGDMQAICNFIEQYYFKVFDNRDYRWSNELTIKTAFLTLLFDDAFYIMDSETCLDRGYADLTMIIRPDMRKYQLLDILIEFKYLSLQDISLTGSEVKALTRDELKTLSPVQKKVKESLNKLKGYQQTLKNNYGSVLRLRSYTVVSIGFDRLIWLEIKP